jgi:hypothetical protein
MHDARIFYEYTQVLAGDTTNKMSFFGGEEGDGDLDAKLVSCIPGV